MVMEQHGVKWLQKGTHEKHLSVLDFEKQERKRNQKVGVKVLARLQIHLAGL